MPNPNPKRHKATEFKPSNTAALRHGGAAAVRAIQRSEPLTGPAREAELRVDAALETQGRYHLVKRDAVRLQACCDLYWAAIVRLVEKVGDGEPADVMILKLDKYVKRFGWLAGASLRAWAQVKEEEPEAGHLADYEILLKGADGE